MQKQECGKLLTPCIYFGYNDSSLPTQLAAYDKSLNCNEYTNCAEFDSADAKCRRGNKMDWQVWSEFFRQNWLIILVALIILFMVINLVKTVIKWLIVIIIVVAVCIYSGISIDQIRDTVSGVTGQTVAALQEQAMDVMKDEAKSARFIQNGDGTYTIKTDTIELKGTPGAGKVGVTFRGVPLGEWEINSTIRSMIDQAKKNTAAGASS